MVRGRGDRGPGETEPRPLDPGPNVHDADLGPPRRGHAGLRIRRHRREKCPCRAAWPSACRWPSWSLSEPRRRAHSHAAPIERDEDLSTPKSRLCRAGPAGDPRGCPGRADPVAPGPLLDEGRSAQLPTARPRGLRPRDDSSKRRLRTHRGHRGDRRRDAGSRPHRRPHGGRRLRPVPSDHHPRGTEPPAHRPLRPDQPRCLRAGLRRRRPRPARRLRRDHRAARLATAVRRVTRPGRPEPEQGAQALLSGDTSHLTQISSQLQTIGDQIGAQASALGLSC